MATLTLSSSLQEQPPSGLIKSVGPVLSLSFAPVGTSSLISTIKSKVCNLFNQSSTEDITFVIDFSNSTASGFEGSAAFSQFIIPNLSVDFFYGASGTVDMVNKKATISVSPQVANSFDVNVSQTTLNGFLANVRDCPGVARGGKVWDSSQNKFIDFSLDSFCQGVIPDFDPNKRTLVLVHGILSFVEDAFGQDCNGQAAATKIRDAGDYEQVIGFNYDWTQGILESGKQLSDFLNCLKQRGLSQVDIEAHSAGVPVSLAAAGTTNISIGNLVSLGGPIMGSPLADHPEGIKMLLSHWPTGCLKGQPLDKIINGDYLPNLASSSNVLPNIRTSFNNRSQHPNVFVVCGDEPFLSPVWPILLKTLGIYEETDSVVPVNSCLGIGPSGDSLINIKRFDSLTFPLKHTDLECNQDVINSVGNVVKPCGDGICDPNIGENSTTCPADCPPPSPIEDTYIGPFSGTTTETDIGCSQWKGDIYATITITVSGSGTLIDPYTGTMKVEGSAVVSLVYCNYDCYLAYCDPGGTVALSGTGTVSGSQGKVEASASGTVGTATFTASFTGGTFNGNTLTGTLTFNSEGQDAPITKTIVLIK